MFLIPRELYLKVINSTNQIEDQGSEPLSLMSKKSNPLLYAHEPFKTQPPGYSANPYLSGEDNFSSTSTSTTTNTDVNMTSASSNNEWVPPTAGGNSNPRSDASNDDFFSGLDSPMDMSQERIEPTSSGWDRFKTFFNSAFQPTGPHHSKSPSMMSLSSSHSAPGSITSSNHKKSYKPSNDYPSVDQKYSKEKIERPAAQPHAKAKSTDGSDRGKKASKAKSTDGSDGGKKQKSSKAKSTDGKSDYPAFDKNFAKEDFNFKKPDPPPSKPKPNKTPSSKTSKSSKDEKKKKTRGARFTAPSQLTSDSSGSSTTSSMKRRYNLKQAQCSKLVNKIINTREDDYYTIMDASPTWSVKDLSEKFKSMRVLIHPDKCRHPDAVKASQKLFYAYSKLVEQRGEMTDRYFNEERERERERNSRFYQNFDYEKERQEYQNFTRPGGRFYQNFDYDSERQRQENFTRAKQAAEAKKREESMKRAQQQAPPKQRGPPTKTYSSSPLRPPPTGKRFNNSNYFYGSGIKSWLKL